MPQRRGRMRVRVSGLQRTSLRTGGRRRREETHGEQYWERGYSGQEGKAGQGSSVTKAEEGLPRSAGKDFCPTACPHP